MQAFYHPERHLQQTRSWPEQRTAVHSSAELKITSNKLFCILFIIKEHTKIVQNLISSWSLRALYLNCDYEGLLIPFAPFLLFLHHSNMGKIPPKADRRQKTLSVRDLLQILYTANLPLYVRRNLTLSTSLSKITFKGVWYPG